MKRKKLLAVLLSLSVVISGLAPAAAYAEEQGTDAIIVEEAQEDEEAEPEDPLNDTDSEAPDEIEEEVNSETYRDDSIEVEEDNDEQSLGTEAPETIKEDEKKEPQNDISDNEIMTEDSETFEIDDYEELDLDGLEIFDGEDFLMTELGEIPSFGYYREMPRTLASRSAVSSGVYGKINWEFDSSTGVLNLSGSGAVTGQGKNLPWAGFEKSIKKVKIEKGITSIGEAVFYQYFHIETVELPSTLTEIGKAAFADCIRLSQITFNQGLKTIGAYAFQQCPIREIHLPDSVQTVAPLAFYSCWGLAKITVASGNGTYCAIDNILYSKNKSILYYSPQANEIKNINIPSGVKTIESAAFLKSQMTSVVIPNSVQVIKDSAFQQTALTTLKIPDSVKEIGMWTAYESESLRSVEIGSGLKLVESLSFAYCSALETVIFSKGVKQIANGAFGECISLKRVTFPATLEEILYQAFLNCSQLESITLPGNLKEINRLAFWGTGLRTVSVPSSVTFIGEQAFPQGTKVSYPSGLTVMEDGSYIKVASLYIQTQEYYTEAFAVLNIVNQERQKAGLAALKMDKELLAAAMKRAAETTVYFDHTRPSNMDFATVSAKASGENIAAGYATAARVMEGWMSSPGHKANILTNAYQSVGIGCVKVNGMNYWVQLFGTGTAAAASSGSYKNKTGETQVITNVNADFYSASLKAEKTSLNAGNTTGLTYYCHNGFVNVPVLAKSFTYTSSNKNICTVNSAGRITAVKRGNATVSVYPKGNENAKNQVKITVNKGSQTITAKSCTKMYGNKAFSLGVKRTKGDGKLTYKSSNTKIAAVSSAGKVTIKGTGKATITITAAATANYNKTTKKITITVKPKKAALLAVKSKEKKKATVTWKKDSRATGYQIQYSTSSSFKSGNKKVSIAKNSTNKKILSGMKSRKKYYVRIRSYKTISGKKVYGSWSARKSVKIR